MDRRSATAARQALPVRPAIGLLFSFTVALALAACSGGSAATPTPQGPGPGASGASLAPFQTPTPSPGGTVDGRTIEEQLQGLLPGGGTGAKCQSATDVDARAAQARIKCTYKSLSQTVWLSQYEDADGLAAAYEAQQDGAKSGGKGCEAGRFHGEFAVAGTRIGQLACLKRKSDAWLVWSMDQSYILGEATRTGDKSKALYDWWHQKLPVGAKGALKLTKTTPAPESPAPSPT